LIRHWKESTDGVVVGLRYDGDATKGNFLPKPNTEMVPRSRLKSFMWPMIGYLTTMGGRLLPN
jgi:hypothetical protein